MSTLPAEKGRVVVADAEQVDVGFLQPGFGQKGPHDGFVVAAVGDADGFAPQVGGSFLKPSPVRPVDPLERVDLEQLGQHHHPGALGQGPDDLVGRGHAELGIAQLQLLDGIPFRPPGLDRDIQPPAANRPWTSAYRSPAVLTLNSHLSR